MTSMNAPAEISKKRRFEILAILRATVCAACGKAKSSMRSHCRACYYTLPPTMRAALYRGFGDGYEEAFESSLKYLAEHNSSSEKDHIESDERSKAESEK